MVLILFAPAVTVERRRCPRARAESSAGLNGPKHRSFAVERSFPVGCRQCHYCSESDPSIRHIKIGLKEYNVDIANAAPETASNRNSTRHSRSRPSVRRPSTSAMLPGCATAFHPKPISSA